MNLNEQATQPHPKAYRTCERCGARILSRKSRARFCSRHCSSKRRTPNNPEPTAQEIAEGVRRIELTQGQFAIVDAADYDWVNQWNWYACKESGIFYAARNEYDATILPHKQVRIMIHRALLDPPSDKWVDHKDRNPLNNRRANLRLATPTQNAQNRSKARNKCIAIQGCLMVSRPKKMEVVHTSEGRGNVFGASSLKKLTQQTLIAPQPSSTSVNLRTLRKW